MVPTLIVLKLPETPDERERERERERAYVSGTILSIGGWGCLMDKGTTYFSIRKHNHHFV